MLRGYRSDLGGVGFTTNSRIGLCGAEAEGMILGSAGRMLSICLAARIAPSVGLLFLAGVIGNNTASVGVGKRYASDISPAQPRFGRSICLGHPPTLGRSCLLYFRADQRYRLPLISLFYQADRLEDNRIFWNRRSVAAAEALSTTPKAGSPLQAYLGNLLPEPGVLPFVREECDGVVLLSSQRYCVGAVAVIPL